jgi:hypothetical protein
MMDNTEKTKLITERLNLVGIKVFHDFQNTIMMPVTDFNGKGCNTENCGVNIIFGHVNETYGASVETGCGTSLGYIETNTVFEDSTVDVICKRMLEGIFEWKREYDDQFFMENYDAFAIHNTGFDIFVEVGK